MKYKLWTPENCNTEYRLNADGTVINMKTGNHVGCTNDRGYKYFQYTDLDGKRKQQYVGRLLAQLFISNPKERKQVIYKDGNRSNCAVTNIEWGTGIHYAEKNKKMWRTKGTKFNSRLTDADVRAIRSSIWNPKRLAAKYDLTRNSIYGIIKRRTFKWVE